MIALFLVLKRRGNRLMILVLPSEKFQFFHTTSSPDNLRQDTSFSLSLNSLLFASSKRICEAKYIKNFGLSLQSWQSEQNLRASKY